MPRKVKLENERLTIFLKICLNFWKKEIILFLEMSLDYSKRDYNMKIKNVFLVLLIIFLVFGNGCRKKQEVLSFRIAVSPDDKKIAFLKGPRTNAPENPFPDDRKSKLYILDLNDNTIVSTGLPDRMSFDSLSIGWRPLVNPPELYVSVRTMEEPLPLERKLIRIVVEKEKALIETCECNLPYVDSVGALSWSPDGQTLAIACLTRLFFSYDTCKTLTKTSIGGFLSPRPPVWTNNDKVYVSEQEALLEVTLNDKIPKLKHIIESDDNDVRIFGAMKNEPIYTVGAKIYHGENLFYESEKIPSFGFVNESFAAFWIKAAEDNIYVLVLDEKGNIIRKKNIEKRTWLAGISPLRKFVYLMNNTSIYQYNFEDDALTKIYDSNSGKI
jgi:hypothetical protein